MKSQIVRGIAPQKCKQGLWAKMRSVRGLIFGGFLFWGLCGQAGHLDFSRFQSSFLQLRDSQLPRNTRGEPWLAEAMRWNELKYSPSGHQGLVPDGCKWNHEMQLRSFTDWARESTAYLARCESQITTGPRDDLSGTLKTLMIRMRTDQHPYGKAVYFNMPGGVKLEGFLALHSDHQKRPLIIFRAGIFSNANEFFAERFLFHMLFEQSPFNVLVLESMTGTEFNRNNKGPVFGGLDEAMQVLEILKRVKDPSEPLSGVVSEVHLMGISMGGAGQVFARALAPLQKAIVQPQSVLLFCPMLEMEDTFNFQLDQGLKTLFLQRWTRGKLAHLAESEPEALREWSFLQDLIRLADKRYRGPVSATAETRWPAGWGSQIQDFLKAQKLIQKLPAASTPLQIFVTRHDPMVPSRLNADKLTQGKIKLGENVQVTTFEEGIHCSLPGPYDWQELSTLFQSYFRNFSVNLNEKTETLSVDLTEHEAWALAASLDFSLKFESGQDYVNVQIFDSRRGTFDFLKFWERPQKSIRLSLASLDWQRSGGLMNQEDEDLLRRWLNQNLSIRVVRTEPRLILSWPVFQAQ